MKKRKIILAVIILCFVGLSFYIYYYCSCLYRPPGPDATSSMKESKQLGIFLREYTIKPDEFSLPNGKRIKIKYIWLEKGFHYINRCKNIIETQPNYSIYFHFNKNAVDSIGYEFGRWALQNDSLGGYGAQFISDNIIKYDTDSLRESEKFYLVLYLNPYKLIEVSKTFQLSKK